MSSKPVTIHAAKTQLSRLIERACDGEDIVIARRDQPVVRLVPIPKAVVKRKFGSMKGLIEVSDTFFEPLPDDELERWGV